MNLQRRTTGAHAGASLVAEAVLDAVSVYPMTYHNTVTTSNAANAPVGVAELLVDRFRYPWEAADFVIDGDRSQEPGYFRIGPDVIGFGQCSSGAPAKFMTSSLHDTSEHIVVGESSVHLPFDPVQVVDNLRCERYTAKSNRQRALLGHTVFRNMYYRARPLLGIPARRYLQKLYFKGWENILFPSWPVDRTVESFLEQLLVLEMRRREIERLPFIWFWPNAAKSCTLITHDVETAAGRELCPRLMDLDDQFGIKSSFQIIPEGRYAVPEAMLADIRRRRFEINIHDLNHDGLLMSERKEFLRRAQKINRYGREFGASGFRSGVMYRNTDWYEALDFAYDMSVPNVAHLDAQQGGCCTVLPYFVGNILELPVTTTQDYTLFNILNDYSLRLWKEQISLIREKHGLISFIIHPDYTMNAAAKRIYVELLDLLCDMRTRRETWIALPNEVDTWWRMRQRMFVVKVGSAWRIIGEGSGRASLAYAVLDRGSLRYELPSD